jgi:ferrochelatase
LPEKIVAAGDPYRWQVEQTAAAIIAKIGDTAVEWSICYQSRVGPLKWIGPATLDEIRRAGRDGVSVLVAPIAFVSEHSETLVELDIEYRKAATAAGVPEYRRLPTVSVRQEFIAGLARMVAAAVAGRSGTASAAGARICPVSLTCCAMASR